MLDQIWLFIILAGLVSGLTVTLVLILLKYVLPVADMPVRLHTALAAMGTFALLGVYLRILDISREGVVYNSFRSLAWAFFLYEYGRYGFPRLFRRFWFLVPLTSVLLFFIDSYSYEAARTTVVVLSSVFAVTSAVATGVRAVRSSSSVTSIPVKRFYKAFGLALIVFSPAYLGDIGLTYLLNLRGWEAKDGLVFALTYLSTNFVIIFFVMSGIRKPAPVISAGHLPSSFLTVYGLTPREAEIVTLVLQGRQNQQIARELCISSRTVDTHLHNIFRKCGISSRNRLFSIVAGFGPQNDPAGRA